MKTLVAFALIVGALAPAVVAQTVANFTGKWEGTFTIQRPDGPRRRKISSYARTKHRHGA